MTVINRELLNPKSIVFVGGSDNVTKPAGKLISNVKQSNFEGDLYVINPKATSIQGIACVDPETMPQVEMAIIGVAAKFIKGYVELLATKKGCKAFIIISAGFSEMGAEGKKLQDEIVEIIAKNDGCLIGPNCTGVFSPHYNALFAGPMPKHDSKGVDFVSGSGATAAFIMEECLNLGLSFNSVFAVGNSAQINVEDVIEYWDETFEEDKSSKIKMIYVEAINDPQKLLKHASSLISKGCKICAVKSGSSSAGSKAASSHTGALASPDLAVETLFRKAGIVRCSGRDELVTVAAIFTQPEIKGKNIAIVTHAGGPGVMLTDALSHGGLEIPTLEGPKADALLAKLFDGSCVSNPIDFLATGTAEQLGAIIDAMNDDFDNIDAIPVIFGSPGLGKLTEPYKVIAEKMKTSKKPIYPIFPSIITAKEETEMFKELGGVYFPDEVNFGKCLVKVANTPKPEGQVELPKVDKEKIRAIVDNCDNGYISPKDIQGLLDAAGIDRAGEAVVKTAEDAIVKAKELGFPVVMKVVGPVHKSDVGGVVLNVKDEATVEKEFKRMIEIKDTTAILLQPMLSGTELFCGAKKEDKFGHMVLCGMGGIFIEVFKDTKAEISPVSKNRAFEMISSLKSYKIIKGVRGQEGISEEKYADTITKLSALLEVAPEIFEIDLNPLLGTKDRVVAVDARIRIEK